MIVKFVSNFEDVEPAPQEFLGADGDQAAVTFKGIGKTKSGNELSGDSLWLYKMDGGKIIRAQVLRRHRNGSRGTRLAGRGRLGLPIPDQLLDLDDHPILRCLLGYHQCDLPRSLAVAGFAEDTPRGRGDRRGLG